MTLLPIRLPPGIYKNGTELDAAGRWFDGNLVRWVEGMMRPVGGWQERTTTTLTGKPRAILTWRDNSATRQIAVGTHSKLYAVSQSSVIYDITPTGFTPGNADASVAGGFGVGFYSDGYYGTPRADVGTITPATTWTLDTWGEYLVGCANSDGKIYEWQLDTSGPTPAAVVTNAPTGTTAIMVSNERSLFALGAGGNPRRISWSDFENNTVWTPASDNLAGSIDLQTGGKIVVAKRVRGQILVLTDIDAHVVSYVGQPFVYQSEYVGRSCGIPGPNAIAVQDNFAVWMSTRGFFTYDGYIKPLPSEVSDYVFSDINRAQMSKVYAVNNSQFNEVWWFYPSASSQENDRYVVWNYADNYWTIGEMARSAGTDRGVFTNPIFVGTDGILYDHEVGVNHDGTDVYVESGPVQIGNGDNIYYVNELIPDERNQGDVTATFYSRYYPNSTQRSYGPYSMTNPTSVRFNGRQVNMRLTATPNTDWRVGTMRLNAAPGGRR
jgi:hypothetical protein